MTPLRIRRLLLRLKGGIFFSTGSSDERSVKRMEGGGVKTLGMLLFFELFCLV